MQDEHSQNGNGRSASQPAPNQPADVIRDTNLKATIWRNESEKGPFYATSFARTFRDQDGQLHDTNSFVAADLLKLSELARKAYDRTTELRRDDREQAKAVSDPEREDRRAAFKQDRMTGQSRGGGRER